MQLRSSLLGLGVAALSLSAGLEGLRRVELSLGGQQLAAAPSPPLMVLGASAILALGSWLCIVLLRHRRAGLTLILAWSSAAALLAVLFHLSHSAYGLRCHAQAVAQAPPSRRCVELQLRGRL
jgi:hypothetical protein